MADALSFELIPSGGDELPYPAEVFASQFTALLRALNEATRYYVGRRAEHVHYKILSITTNSPIRGMIEPQSAPFLDTPVEMGKIHKDVLSGLMDITRGAEPHKCINYAVLEQLRILARPIGEGMRGGWIADDDLQLSLNYSLKQSLDRIKTADYVERGGQVKGLIEQMNIHAKKRVFTLYPAHGSERVRCYFRSSLLKEVTACMGRGVVALGDVHYRWREKWPYAVKITSIRPLKEASELPKFGDLWGVAPDAAGGIASEDFVRRLRNGED